MDINVKAPKAAREADFNIEDKLFTSSTSYIEAYGEEATVNLITRMIVTDLRNGARAKMDVIGDKAVSDEAITAWIAEWKPGNRKAAKSKTEKTLDAFESLTEEQQIAALQKMQETLANMQDDEDEADED